MNECIVCQKSKTETLFSKYQINQCSCGHVYYVGDLNDEKIKAIYSENYFKGEEYLDYKSDKFIHQKNFKNKLNNVLKYQKSGRLLEIGSAYGFFLELAQKHFTVKGFEICKEAAEFAKNDLKLDVTCADVTEANLNEQFDVVTMYDCIEHIPRPDKVIEVISKNIKKGGSLFLTTGDIGAPLAKFQGEDWRLIHPPSHIHYFNQRSITQLLKNYGFTVVKINYPGIWRSVALVVDNVFKMPRLAKKFNQNSFWINTFDIMEVVAVKE